jgi:hypothetical protein
MMPFQSGTPDPMDRLAFHNLKDVQANHVEAGIVLDTTLRLG